MNNGNNNEQRHSDGGTTFETLEDSLVDVTDKIKCVMEAESLSDLPYEDFGPAGGRTYDFGAIEVSIYLVDKYYDEEISQEEKENLVPSHTAIPIWFNNAIRICIDEDPDDLLEALHGVSYILATTSMKGHDDFITLERTEEEGEQPVGEMTHIFRTRPGLIGQIRFTYTKPD